MDRRAYLAVFGSASLGGCLEAFSEEEDTPNPGDVMCTEARSSASSNGPGDGSWPTELYDMQNTGQTDAPGPDGCVETRWTWRPTEERMSAGPVVANGKVYIPHQLLDDSVFGVLDAATGGQQWQHVDEEHPLDPPRTPTLAGNQLYLVHSSALMNVDVQARSLSWFHDASDHSDSSLTLEQPRVANERVYLGAEPGYVIAVDEDTGEHRWTYDIEGLPSEQVPEDDSDTIAEARRQGDPYAPVAVTESHVYVTSWDFSLYALDAATGERQWRFSLGSHHLDVMHAPVVVDGAVYIQTENAILYVLDAETGEHRWTFDEMGRATDGVSPVVDDDSVYITAGTSTEDLYLVALNRADRSVRWKRSIGPPFQNPVGDADTLYVDQGRDLHALDKGHGELKWRVRLNRSLAAPAAIADGAVYVPGSRGSISGVW